MLVRSAKGVTLSPYGAMTARRSRAVQKEVDKIREEVDSLRGGLGGRLSIGLTPPAAGAQPADAISEFRRERPLVEIQLLEFRPAQITEGLRDGTLDLGIITQYGQAGVAGFSWTQLYSLKTLLATGGARASTKVSLNELGEMEWLALDGIDDPNGDISTLCSHFNLPMPSRIVRCSSIAALYLDLSFRLNAVTHWGETGFGRPEQHFREGRMTRLELAGPTPHLNVELVYQEEDLLTQPAIH